MKRLASDTSLPVSQRSAFPLSSNPGLVAHTTWYAPWAAPRALDAMRQENRGVAVSMPSGSTRSSQRRSVTEKEAEWTGEVSAGTGWMPTRRIVLMTTHKQMFTFMRLPSPL